MTERNNVPMVRMACTSPDESIMQHAQTPLAGLKVVELSRILAGPAEEDLAAAYEAIGGSR